MESKFTIKDSGARQEFPTGSRRDTDEGKPRLSLVPPLVLSRLAMVYTNGAKKYGDNNWQKGQPLSRYYDSAMRHMLAAREGREDEDHLFQAAWNLAAIAWTLEECRAGRLPANLVDLPFRMPGDTAKKLDELFLGPTFGGLVADHGINESEVALVPLPVPPKFTRDLGGPAEVGFISDTRDGSMNAANIEQARKILHGEASSTGRSYVTGDGERIPIPVEVPLDRVHTWIGKHAPVGGNHPKSCVCSRCTTPKPELEGGDADGHSRTAPTAVGR